MTCARPRGVRDCCDTALRDQIRWIMSRLGSIVRRVHFNGHWFAPDGNGDVDLGNMSPGAELVDQTGYYTLEIYDADMVALSDRGTYWEITVT